MRQIYVMKTTWPIINYGPMVFHSITPEYVELESL